MRDIVTMTGLRENKVNRLVRMRVDGPGEDSDDDADADSDDPVTVTEPPRTGEQPRRRLPPRTPTTVYGTGKGRVGRRACRWLTGDAGARAAVRDPAVVARYRAKVLEVPGSDCLWWQERCPAGATDVLRRHRARTPDPPTPTGRRGSGPVRDRAPVRLRALSTGCRR